MALAKITLLGCATYTHAGKTYKKNAPVTTSNAREIAWAETNGFFMVVDLEAEKKALEAEIVQARAAEEAATKAKKARVIASRRSSTLPKQPSDGGSEGKTEESSDGGE